MKKSSSNKLKGLFLDDERVPQDVTWVKYPKNVEWTVVRNSDEFFKEFSSDEFNVMSFDHDLKWYVNGYAVLKAMVYSILYCCDPYEKHNIPEQMFFHTQNNVAKTSMEAYWKNFCKHYEEN